MNNIIIVRRNPTVAKNMPMTPAAVAPRMALFILIMLNDIDLNVAVNS